MKNIDITEILKLISVDDRRAFDIFYHRYYKQIYRYLYYQLMDTEACSELVSNVFYSVWKSRRSLSEVKSIEAYLYTVARNEVKQYWTSTIKNRTVSLEEMPVHFDVDSAENPEEFTLAEEANNVLSRAIARLPERCRAIFLLSRNDGLSSVEIARKLSLSESTVRVQLKIAVDKLVEDVREHYPHLFLFIFLLIS